MKIVSGKSGEPHVTAQQFRQIIEGTVGQESCILTSGEFLEPELSSNNLLRIRSGMMSHHGNISCVELGTYDEVTIQNGTQGMKRIDLVVNRYTKNDETGIEENDWVVIMGTPSEGDPEVPAYTEGNLQEGDLVDDCPVFEVHLDGINVTGIKELLSVSKNMYALNADLAEKVYDQSDFPMQSFYRVGDYDLRKRGNEAHLNVSLSMKPGTQFDPNTKYKISPEKLPEELRPTKTFFLSAYGCDTDWGNPVPVSAYVEPDGYVWYCASTRRTYFKISGHWITG